MASTDPAATSRRHYGEHLPDPDPPARLADLTGPISGVTEMPITIDWGPKRTYDMGRDADRRVVYEFVLQDASTPEELAKYVREAPLRRVVAVLVASAWTRVVGGALP